MRCFNPLALLLLFLLGCCSCSESLDPEAPAVDSAKIQQDLLSFVEDSYPDMQIDVRPWDEDPERLAIYFIEAKFSLLYPQQRFHYLTHLIPADYQESHLQNSVWFELAPGETPADLRYPDDQLIADITSDVLKVVNAAQIFETLDNVLSPLEPGKAQALCYGDYRHTRKILLERGFTNDEFFDVFHVFMAQGGFCDCEILYNVAPSSRLATEYLKNRGEGKTPYDPHQGT
jgi:hypothetical protein